MSVEWDHKSSRGFHVTDTDGDKLSGMLEKDGIYIETVDRDRGAFLRGDDLIEVLQKMLEYRTRL